MNKFVSVVLTVVSFIIFTNEINGECCSSNLCLSKEDKDQVLCFSITLNDFSMMFSDSPLNGHNVIVTAVIYTPSGCLIEGTSQEFFSDSEYFSELTFNFDGHVSVCNPECGVYKVGVEILADANPDSVNETNPSSKPMIFTVFSTRSCKTTSLQQPSRINFVEPKTSCFQILSLFGYSPDFCVLDETSCSCQ